MVINVLGRKELLFSIDSQDFPLEGVKEVCCSLWGGLMSKQNQAELCRFKEVFRLWPQAGKRFYFFLDLIVLHSPFVLQSPLLISKVGTVIWIEVRKEN